MLSFVLLFLTFTVNKLQIKADTKNVQNHYIIYQYSNGEISNDKIKFELYSTDAYFPTQANNKAVSVRAYSFFWLYINT